MLQQGDWARAQLFTAGTEYDKPTIYQEPVKVDTQ